MASQSVFIGVGVLLGFAVVVASAPDPRRRLRASLLFGWSGIAGFAGARLLWAFGAESGPFRGSVAWSSLLDPAVPGLWSFGAIGLGGAAAAFAAGRMSDGHGGTLLDVVVPAALTTLIVARLGCLAAGCDFGAPTSLEWGLQYPPETPAWEAHRRAGLVGAEATRSAPTHPLPLYLAAVALVSILVGTFAAARSNAPAGSRAFAVAACYLLGRFIVEFFRSPQAAAFAWRGFNLNHGLVLATLGCVVLGGIIQLDGK